MTDSGSNSGDESRSRSGPLFDLEGIDLGARLYGRDHIAEVNPHRGEMALLDSIVWEAPAKNRGVALKLVRDDEFWVPGHFPGQPIMPGVLQVEAGAQLACYLYQLRQENPGIGVFLRIENATFRSMVVPGDELFLLCQDVKAGRRRFICDLQGLVGGQRVAFESRIVGMMQDR